MTELRTLARIHLKRCNASYFDFDYEAKHSRSVPATTDETPVSTEPGYHHAHVERPEAVAAGGTKR